MGHLKPEELDTGGRILAARRRAALLRVLAATSFLVALSSILLMAHAVGVLLSRPEWRAYLQASEIGDAVAACLLKLPCLQAAAAVSGKLHLVSFPWVALAGVGLGGVFLLGASLISKVRPSKLPGAAKLSSDTSRFLKGISYLGVKDGKVLRYPGDLRFKHTLIIGSTGAGKTSRIIRPTLAYAAKEGRSAVVIDLKYPDVSLLGMIPVFEAYGRNVIVLLPYDKRSPRIPFLKGAEDERVAQKLAEVIIPVEEREGVTSYYANIERELLQRLIHLEATYGKGSLGRIRFYCQRGPKGIAEYIETHYPDAASYFGAFFDLSTGKQAELAWGLVGKLKAFGDPLVDRFTSFGPGEVDLRSIAHTPTLVYLGIPQERLQDAGGQVLLQLFKRYLDWIFLEESKQTGRLNVPVEVFLDEFTNLGFLPRMSDNLSTMRSRRVGYVLALQSFNQALERYREEEVESIIANCNTWIILPRALSDLDAERISRALGNTTVYVETEGRAESHILNLRDPWPRFSENYRVEKIPLLSPEEMRNLPEDTVLVRFSDGDPMVVEAPRLDQVLERRGAPAELKEIASFVAEAEAKYNALLSADIEDAAAIAADYITAPYLVPEEPEEERGFQEEARSVQESKETLFQWFEESALKGGQVTVHRSPDGKRVTKVSLYPPAGLVPKEAEEWERAKWIKLEKGKKVVSLVPPVLEEFQKRKGVLVEAAELLGKVRAWTEANAARLEGHPAQRPGEPSVGKWKRDKVVASLDDLAGAGVPSNLALRYGREVRYQNRRGYVELPLTLGELLGGLGEEGGNSPSAQAQ